MKEKRGENSDEILISSDVLISLYNKFNTYQSDMILRIHMSKFVHSLGKKL